MTAIQSPVGEGTDQLRPPRYWYLFALSGAITLVVGVLILAYPDPSVKVLGVIVGIDLLIAGTIMIIRGVESAAADSTITVLLGVLALIAGIIVIRNPTKSVTFLVLVLGIFLVVEGALVLARAIAQPGHRLLTALRGLVLVAAGTLIVSWPDLSTKTLAILAGIAFCLQGAMEIAESLFLRSVERSGA